MKDRVVFITGAKGGLGSFITRRFLETGATVVGASRSISQQEFLRPNFTALIVDFTKAAAVNDAVQSVITYLRKSGRGRIVAIGSLTAVEPHSQLAAYVTFKAALAMLVRTVALENKDAGLTAHVVLPGTMDTPANREAMPDADFSKWIQPKDVVNLVLSLTTERASQVTGAVIPIGNHNV